MKDCWHHDKKGKHKQGKQKGGDAKRQKVEVTNEANEEDLEAMQVKEVTFMTEEDHDTQMNLPNEGQKSHSNNYNVNHMNQNDEHVIFYDWLADSATTSHICNQKEVFVTYEPLTGKTMAGVGNKHANVEGHGTIELESAF